VNGRFVVVRLSLAVGCKHERDETCVRASDIEFRSNDGLSSVTNPDERRQMREDWLDRCERAFTDTPGTDTDKVTNRIGRERAECDAAATECVDYRLCVVGGKR
jgi:hypothetical protein